MKLKELVDHALESAKGISSSGQDVNAALLMVDEDGKLSILGLPDYAECKEFSLAAMKAALEFHKAERYAFVFEAWVSIRKPGSPDLHSIRPSKDPERTEAIVVIAKERGGEKVAKMAQIRRHGHKVTFKDEAPGGFEQMLGVTDNLFGELGRPQ